MQHKTVRGNVLLLIAAIIWGSAFVAQSAGMEFVGPFSFNAVRCLVGGIALIPCVWLFTRTKGWKDLKGTVLGGAACGLVLFTATSLQQVAIQYTTVGKAGFLTAMYIVLVPVIRAIRGKKSSARVWISVAVAVFGIYFLCTKERFTIGIGDALMILCAFAFALHICVVDHFCQKYDGVRLSCVQFIVSGIVSLPFMFFEQPSVGQLLSAWLPILYAGLLSSGIAYTFQILGQKDTNPVVASLIMSTESLFAALSGWIVLGQGMSPRELFGSLLLIFAIVFVQLPARIKTPKLNLKS